jgi:predicted ArsR family transcriptional regulator
MSRDEQPPGERLRKTIELGDPRALRALAHPTRLALIGLVRREGPHTATQAARRLGETPQRCTFHFSQLAKYGLVEEAPGGRGRERPWRATAARTSWPSAPQSPELAAAASMVEHILAERYFHELMGWLARKPDEPAVWQEAAPFGDSLLHMTATELAELGTQIDELVERFQERSDSAGDRPADARPIWLLHLAFPTAEGERPAP